MKKIGIILAVVAVTLVCSSFTFSVRKDYTYPVVDVREVGVGGHKYVVATSFNHSGQCGVSITHSEGCFCKNK